MRILCLNPNTSAHVTEIVARTLRAELGAAATVLAATASFGPSIIKTRLDHAVAQHGAVTLAAQHADAVDGVLLAVSYDTAADALREALAIPVVGMSEASIAAARLVGGRIGYLTIGARAEPLYREALAAHDLDRDLAAFAAIDAPGAHAPGGAEALDQTLVTAIAALVDRGADIVVLLGAVLAGASTRLQPRAEVPLIDGGRAGALMIQAMIRLGAPKPRRGAFAPTGDRALTGVDPALARLAAPGAQTDGERP